MPMLGSDSPCPLVISSFSSFALPEKAGLASFQRIHLRPSSPIVFRSGFLFVPFIGRSLSPLPLMSNVSICLIEACLPRSPGFGRSSSILPKPSRLGFLPEAPSRGPWIPFSILVLWTSHKYTSIGSPLMTRAPLSRMALFVNL